MAKDKMRDLVILLPGITGSVLQKNGEDLWALSGQTLWRFLRHRREQLKGLRLPQHNAGSVCPDDGVRATSVIDDFHGVFGFWKIDGYDTTARLVTQNFDVRPGLTHDPQPDQNFFEFPYDWRRSNRESARNLEKFVNDQLYRWRQWSHWKDAKVILLAHSMGGLVSRYYLEVLGGWPDCRALITFGTPYRGALNAVNYLANGYSMAGIDLTDVMRSMPSLYELMPIYEAINVNGNWRRIAETEPEELPEHIEHDRAADALKFHREIETAVESHSDKKGYSLTPVVGIEQPTLQSGTLVNRKLLAGWERPPVVDEVTRSGDGTVPRISATPIELGNNPPAGYFVEIHGSLQKNEYFLYDLRARLQQLQIDPGKPPVRGEVDLQARAAISLNVQDLFRREEPVVVHAEVRGATVSGGLKATLSRSGLGGQKFEQPFRGSDGTYELRLEGLAPGQYHLTVRSEIDNPSAPSPVHDVFEIADEN